MRKAPGAMHELYVRWTEGVAERRLANARPVKRSARAARQNAAPRFRTSYRSMPVWILQTPVPVAGRAGDRAVRTGSGDCLKSVGGVADDEGHEERAVEAR